MTRDTAPATEERLRDADRSQGTILAAARDEFAEYGLGGARMDRIAERAALNKRLIYYYFDDKEKLFEAVLEQAYRHIREAEAQLKCWTWPPPMRYAAWSSSPGTITWTTPSS
jgi:AcrR family transcriptional regulator